jgi:hypothetical protein
MQIVQSNRVQVGYSGTLRERIDALELATDADVINSLRFPIPKDKTKEKVEIVLVKFEQDVSPEQVLGELKDFGYRPITFFELLALLKLYRKRLDQLPRPIIALGSTWTHPRRGTTWAPRFFRDLSINGGYGLGLTNCDDGDDDAICGSGCYFGAARAE